MNNGKERATPSRSEIEQRHQEYVEQEEKERTEQQARQRVDAEREKRERLENIETHLSGCGISKRFLGKTLDNYEAKFKNQKNALDAARVFADGVGGGKPANMILMGAPGTGKNHLATGITRELALALKSVVATTTMKMIKHFRTTWTYGRHAEQSEEVIFELYTTPDLLILDEVGIQYGTESERIMIFDVLNERYGAELSTLLITNLNMEELGSYISERLIDRLKEDGCKVVVFNWLSYRGK